jgi:ADP-ribose pyrophosphatase
VSARGDAELLARREIYRGRIVDLALERVRLPNRHVVELEMVRHRGAAAVVPLLDDGRVALVRQYRHAACGWLLEVPAGTLAAGETPEACAAREIAEETGYRARGLDPLGWVWTTPGFTDERIWLYLATGLEAGTQALDADEALEVEHLPLAEAVEQAVAGEIRDAKSVCALLRAAAHRARR